MRDYSKLPTIRLWREMRRDRQVEMLEIEAQLYGVAAELVTPLVEVEPALVVEQDEEPPDVAWP